MSDWIKVVPWDKLEPGKFYFLSTATPYPGHLILGRALSGKRGWYTKPGIGIHYKANLELRELLKSRLGGLVAIEVPEDHATRWKARKPKFRRSR